MFLQSGGSEASPTALKTVEVVCTVPCRSLLTLSYYHSFGMTDNYFIFIEQPLKLDILKMATAYLRKVSWASCMKFHPEESVRHSLTFAHVCTPWHSCRVDFSLRPQTLIHLIDRKTRKEVGTKFYTGAMCVYHQVNAFEEDGHVVFDVIAYDDNSLYDVFYLDKLKDQIASNTVYCKPRCKRFVLPLSDKVPNIA